MAENQNRLWASYVKAVAGDMTAQAIADQIGEKVGHSISQPTVSRWLRGESSSKLLPGNVAAFAQAFDEPVLAAFLAAGMLDEEDVLSVSEEAVAFVIDLKHKANSRPIAKSGPAARGRRTRRTPPQRP